MKCAVQHSFCCQLGLDLNFVLVQLDELCCSLFICKMEIITAPIIAVKIQLDELYK